MSQKKRIVVVCPGRGTYTKENLSSLKNISEAGGLLLTELDSLRAQDGLPTLTELDSAPSFKTHIHTKGEHASALIYACSHCDFLDLDQDKVEVVAVTGNSMGWYSTLAIGGALDTTGSYHLIQTMGSMMKEKMIGGQIIVPWTDEEWVIQTDLKNQITDKISEVNSRDEHEAYLSIELGGYAVIGGNSVALSALIKELPKTENFPFQLVNHAAFHTPLLEPTSKKAFELISQDIFEKPNYPLIDGRGQIWQPHSTNLKDLYEYTLGHQVHQTYSFTKAIETSLKEFAPDALVLLGPGSTLGGAVGQILIKNKWKGIHSKSDFQKVQEATPYLISLSRPEQKASLL